MIKYSIIICSYNRFSLLQETIVSIIKCIGSREDCELLIIDNNSKDDTTSLEQKYSKNDRVKYFLELNQGLSHSRNRGIKEASGEYIIFFDDDIELNDHYLRHLDELTNNSAIDIIGGKVLPFHIDIPKWLPKKYYYLASIYNPSDTFSTINQLMGANYGMKLSTAHKIGLYNVDLGRKGDSLMGGEESEYISRGIELGFSVYFSPDLIVYHKINEKLNKNYILDYAYLNGKSTRKYYRVQWGYPRFMIKYSLTVLNLLIGFPFHFSFKNNLLFMRLKIAYFYSKGFLLK